MSRSTGKKGRKIIGLPENKWLTLPVILMALVAVGFLLMMIMVDAFPPGMAMTAIGIMLVLMLLTWFLFCRKKRVWRVIGLIIALIYLAVYGLGIYYLATTYTMFARISVDDPASSMEARGVKVSEESFNVYITGIDQWDSEKGYDLERSDVNMIVTVSPQSRKILLTSIPRDTYVPLHRNGAMDKLTHTGIYGVDETINTVEDWLGVELNYYVKANFSAVVDVINAMGGVDVYSDKSFVPVKRSWWTVKKGWNHMNGKETLAFARERKAYDGEDSQRVENQQKVVKAVLDKMLSSSTLLTKYGDILAAAGDSMETNMPTSDMQELIKMQLADLGAWDIEMQKIEGEYDMDYVASLTQESTFLVYKVKAKSYTSVQEKINAVMNPTDSEIAEAIARRQKNSIMSFLKGLKDKKDK